MMLWGNTDRLRSNDTESIAAITIDELVKYYKYSNEKLLMLMIMVLMMVMTMILIIITMLIMMMMMLMMTMMIENNK